MAVVEQAPTGEKATEIESLSNLQLNTVQFMSNLIARLASNLRRVVGMHETRGYISTVGNEMGEAINDDYLAALGVSRLPRHRIGAVLVDLKRRIGGDFFVQHEDRNRLVLGNRRCPFGKSVHGEPALCMMTSNVFGVIAAEATGHATVKLEKTIAQGHGECCAVVDLEPSEEPTPDDIAAAESGRFREYFRA